jgi:quinol monooxygenase YgiN
MSVYVMIEMRASTNCQESLVDNLMRDMGRAIEVDGCDKVTLSRLNDHDFVLMEIWSSRSRFAEYSHSPDPVADRRRTRALLAAEPQVSYLDPVSEMFLES